MRKKELLKELEQHKVMIQELQTTNVKLQTTNVKLQTELDRHIIDAETRLFNEKLIDLAQVQLNTARHGNE